MNANDPPPPNPYSATSYNPYAPPATATIVARSEHEESLLERAPLLRRITAHLIDVAVVCAVMFACLTVWAMVDPPAEELEQQIAVWTCFIPALLVQLTLQASIGQSLGKRLLGLRVVTLDGRPATLARVVFLRNAFPGVLQMFCAVYGIADLFSLFRADGRTMHDRMSRTRVVRSQ